MWPFSTLVKGPWTSQHQHEFMRLVRLQNPRRDVWECNCGERKIEYFNALGGSTIVENALPSNSVENCLLSKDNCNLQGSRLL